MCLSCNGGFLKTDRAGLGLSSGPGAAFAISLRRKDYEMLDIVMLALGLVFFVATIAYVYACDRL